MPRRRVDAEDQERGPGHVEIPHDAVGEQIVLAAMMVDEDARKKCLEVLHVDYFFEPKHTAIFSAMQELARQRLEFDLPTVKQVGDKAVDLDYMQQLAKNRPTRPENLLYHIARVRWDHTRLNAATGPMDALARAIQDPTADPSVIRSLARTVGTAFDDYKHKEYMRDEGELVHEMMQELRKRSDGIVSYSYGIDHLDHYETPGKHGTAIRRMIPGSAPGCMTLITGISSVGKSTIMARMALGMARQKRRILYGVWEMKGNMTLELLAAMSLAYSRERFHMKQTEGGLTDNELIQVEKRATSIAHYIRFLENPFARRRGETRKGGNERNLDLIQHYIAQSGCDVFVADLWARCLVELKPEDEVLALQRQQAMLDELKVHGILVHQQLTKGESVRSDKRPTKAGAKGSAIWTEAPDTIIGVHRPGAHKAVDDNVIELIVLKQRYGKCPQSIEFDWDGDTGLLVNGRTVAFDVGEGESGLDTFFKGKPDGGKKRR